MNDLQLQLQLEAGPILPVIICVAVGIVTDFSACEATGVLLAASMACMGIAHSNYEQGHKARAYCQTALAAAFLGAAFYEGYHSVWIPSVQIPMKKMCDATLWEPTRCVIDPLTQMKQMHMTTATSSELMCPLCPLDKLKQLLKQETTDNTTLGLNHFFDALNQSTGISCDNFLPWQNSFSSNACDHINRIRPEHVERAFSWGISAQDHPFITVLHQCTTKEWGVATIAKTAHAFSNEVAVRGAFTGRCFSPQILGSHVRLYHYNPNLIVDSITNLFSIMNSTTSSIVVAQRYDNPLYRNYTQDLQDLPWYQFWKLWGIKPLQHLPKPSVP